MSFEQLKYLSFTHSAIYLTLLTVWLVPGLAGAELVFGWAHGVGWIVMSLLCIDAVRRRVIPLWLGVMVAVVGGVGPFAGTIGFIVAGTRRGAAGRAIRSEAVPMAINATTVEVVMPAMGDSVSEGTVLEWHKAEGDSVAADETLVEISTDKVDAEVPAPIAGTVVKLHAAEGDTVAVGAVLAEIAPSNGARPGHARTHAGRRPARRGSRDGGASAEAGRHRHAAMGESVTEGVVLEWAKAVGRRRSRPTRRSSRSPRTRSTPRSPPPRPAPSPRSSPRPARRSPSARSSPGSPPAPGAEAGGGAGARADAPPRPAGDAPAPSRLPDGSKATPVARRVAAAHGVDLGPVRGTGPDGRIGKDDVLAAANGGANGAARPPRPRPSPPAPR